MKKFRGWTGVFFAGALMTALLNSAYFVQTCFAATTISGQIISINKGDATIEIKHTIEPASQGMTENKTFLINKDAPILKEGETVTLSDIRAGDSVLIDFEIHPGAAYPVALKITVEGSNK